MFCCSNCFLDLEARALADNNGTDGGTCDFCNTSNVKIVSCVELEDLFTPLIESYINHPSTLNSLGIDKPLYIHEHILAFWPKVFNSTLNPDTVKALLKEIGSSSYASNSALFDEPVELECFLDPSSVTSSLLQEQKWEEFAKEIKESNRFFLRKTIDLRLLETIFRRYEKVYKPGKRFFRGRISNDGLLPILKMGKPPKDAVRSGRANPVGIPYLYISNDEETTIYETRASLYDNVTIAEFKIVEDLKVLSLKDIDDASPLQLQDNIRDFAIHRNYLRRLQHELSRPVKKQETELDYLPTEYLCEFIKYLEFDAVEYKSSVSPNGYNLAVFNDNKVVCLSSRLFQVENIKYTFNPS